MSDSLYTYTDVYVYIGNVTRRPTGPVLPHRIAYLRVSTEEQADSGLGLAAQRSAILADCTRRGWDPPTFIIDDGYGAKTLDRPGITAALDDLAGCRADTLIVAKLDRLSRSLLDFANVVERARKQGWDLVALDTPVDMSTPTGEMMAGIVALFAQYERRLIAERTVAALRAKKASGARLGRPRLLSDATATRIAAMRAAGATVRAIATTLTAEGVPTATGLGTWHPTAVARALRSLQLDAEAEAAARVA